MDEFDSLLAPLSPSKSRPLLGLTVLVVEDSRYACEAIRLLCLRSGARIRRADCLRSARRHLQVYRPSVVIIDMGLPDGCGDELIAEVNAAIPRVSVVLGTSGDEQMQAVAMSAGADDFLPKPISKLALFQQKILAHMPADRQPSGPRPLSNDEVVPDQMAYLDDIAHVADLLSEGQDGDALDYVAQFVSGVAHSAQDQPLELAARQLAEARRARAPAHSDVARIAGLIQERLNGQSAMQMP